MLIELNFQWQRCRRSSGLAERRGWANLVSIDSWDDARSIGVQLECTDDDPRRISNLIGRRIRRIRLHFRPPSGWTTSDRTMKFSTIDSRGNGQSNDVQHECTWCDISGEMNYLLWRTPSPAKAVVTVRSEDKNGNNLNNSRCHGCPTRKRHEFHCKVLGGSDCSAVKQTKEAKSHRGDLRCFDRWKCGKLNQSVGDLFEIVTWTLDCIRRILFKFFKINFRSQVPPGGLDPTKIRKN